MTRIKRAAAVALSAVVMAATVGSSPAMAFKDKDCADFPTQKKAQKYFKKHGGPQKDPSGLDADHDGIACEDLP